MSTRRRAIVLLACTLGALASPVSAKTALSLVQQHVDGKNGVDTIGGASGVALDTTTNFRLYVASREGTLSLFNRELDGLLTFDHAERQGVDGADGLLQASVLATTPGAFFFDVYVGSDSAIALFHDNLLDTVFGQVLPLPSEPTAVAVSPGGETVYVTSDGPPSFNLLRVYGRDGTTGELTAIQDVTGEAGLDRASAVTVSPDGKNVYATGRLANALVVFGRSLTGELFFLQQQEEGVLGVTGMGRPDAVAVSPDGAHVYVGSVSKGVAVFARDSGTGLLTFVESQQAGVTDRFRSLAVSFDGGYVAAADRSGDPNVVALFARDAGTGKLTPLGSDGFDDVVGVAMTIASGTPTVYAASPTLGSVGVFQAVSFDCTPTPKTGCARPADAHRASLYVKRNPSDEGGDRLVWKWIRGAELALDAFGDPVNGSDHVVACVYDGSVAPQPVAEMLVPAAGICKGKPCWKTSGTATIKYKDPWLLPDGVSTLTIKAGAATRSSIKLKGKGGPLPLPSLPLSPPVTVQLQSATDRCWEAIYSTPTLNDSERFAAKAD